MADTLDDFFNQVEQKQRTSGPTLDQFFSQIEESRAREVLPPSGIEGTPAYATPKDELTDSTAVGRILDAFWLGARELWGDTPVGPTQSDMQWMEKHGLAPTARDYQWNSVTENPAAGTVKQVYKNLYTGGAIAIESLFRAPRALFGSAAAGLSQMVQETGLDADPIENIKSLQKMVDNPADTMSGPAGDLVNALDIAGQMIPGATVGPLMFRPGIPKAAAPVLPYVGHSEKVYQGLESPPKDIAARGEGVAAAMDNAITIKYAEKPATGSAALAPTNVPPRWATFEVFTDEAGVGIKHDNGFGDFVLTRNDGTKPFKSVKAAEEFAKERQTRYLNAELKKATEPRPTTTVPPVTGEARTPNVTPEPVKTVDDYYIAAEKVGNVQLSRMKNWTDQQKKAFEERYTTSGASSDLHTRGVVTIADLEQIAKDTPYNVSDLINRKIGEAYTAEDFMRHNNAITKLWEEFDDLATKVQDINATDQVHIDYMRKMHELDAAIANFVGAKAEWGRAGAAQRALYDKIQEMETVQEALKQATTPEAKATLKKSAITPEDIVKDLGGKEKIRKLSERIRASKNKKEASKKIRAANSPTIGDMLREGIYSIGMLSNPKTWGINALGSTMTLAMDAFVVNPIAAAIGTGKRMIGLGKADRVYWTPSMSKAIGLFMGAPEGLKAAWRYLATEQATYGTAKVKTGAIPGKLGRAVRFLGVTPIAATDEFFKAIASHASIVEQANTLAIREGLKPGTKAFSRRIHDIITDPSDEMVIKAAQEASYQTFNEQMGWMGRDFERAMNRGEIGRWAKFLFLPFLRTNVNLFKYPLDYTPLSPVLARNRAILAGKEGIAARDKLMAKMLVGSGLIYWAWQKAENGEITDSGPSDPNQNAIWRLEGNEPNSMRTGDHWTYIGNLDPFAKLLTTTASMQRVKDAMFDPNSAADLGGTLMAAAHDILINKTWANGIGDLMEAMDDKNTLRMEKLIGNTIARTIPASASLITQYEDPGLKDVRSILDVLKSKLPNTVDDLENKVDRFGNDITRQSLFTQVKDNPYAKAMFDAEYFPAPVDRTVHAQGMGMVRGVELTPEQYHWYAKVAGQYLAWAVKSRIDAVGFEQWNKLPIGVRKEALVEVGSKARELATKELLFKYPSITTEAWKQKTIDYGIDWKE